MFYEEEGGRICRDRRAGVGAPEFIFVLAQIVLTGVSRSEAMCGTSGLDLAAGAHCLLCSFCPLIAASLSIRFPPSPSSLEAHFVKLHSVRH